MHSWKTGSSLKHISKHRLKFLHETCVIFRFPSQSCWIRTVGLNDPGVVLFLQPPREMKTNPVHWVLLTVCFKDAGTKTLKMDPITKRFFLVTLVELWVIV